VTCLEHERILSVGEGLHTLLALPRRVSVDLSSRESIRNFLCLQEIVTHYQIVGMFFGKNKKELAEMFLKIY
jgi:hypothetical protein